MLDVPNDKRHWRLLIRPNSDVTSKQYDPDVAAINNEARRKHAGDNKSRPASWPAGAPQMDLNIISIAFKVNAFLFLSFKWKNL